MLFDGDRDDPRMGLPLGCTVNPPVKCGKVDVFFFTEITGVVLPQAVPSNDAMHVV